MCSDCPPPDRDEDDEDDEDIEMGEIDRFWRWAYRERERREDARWRAEQTEKQREMADREAGTEG